ncbi:uncharacterized protein LOC134540442 [Bacillus rossius redtenbacheri]|uniref:uncharacterized protein LOC134540442 n=1 Tax=Bacillus rossius redtenbacheri TaxID=93214 RepID=UPI002FDE9D58
MALNADAVKVVAGAAVALGGIACLVSSAKVSKRGNYPKAKEYDVEEREAEVFLFTCRLPGIPVPDSTDFHHWALVLLFEGNDVRTMEGLVDEESKLYAVYYKEKPVDEGKYYSLGKVRTSPKKVFEMCESNCFNSQEYLPTWQNCQSWVKELAKKLGEGIALKLEEFKTLMETKPFLSKVGKAATSSSNFTSRPSMKASNAIKKAWAPKEKSS